MPSLAPLRTISFPLNRSLTSATACKTPILSSITIHRSAFTSPLSTITTKLPSPPIQVSGFSTSSAQRAASHEDHYDPPTGWLFGVKPGETYQNEGWERVWVWGFWGSLAVGAVAYAYKPDTSIQTWALEEARRRLEAEGILPDPDTTGDAANKN